MKTAGAVLWIWLSVAAPSPLELGKPVPDVQLGGDSLSGLVQDAKVVAVYFWSCDCPFGPPNYAQIKAAAERFAQNPKVRIFVVSSSGEPEAKGQQWAKGIDLKATFIHDEDRKIARHFRARRVNATFVLDAKGNLVYRGGIADGKSNFLIEAVQACLDGRILPASDQKFEGSDIGG